ncbi:hypothetical protein BX616_005207 [Lobosporangium transversale]|uniref:EF-hand domain-containing protein n=1 Tax=Lobosporangium transversale TaxID=64571 RepID=A0A1Y2GB27_9FUNG|nr:hypothetical protein BCR41DRAFT_425350 [Lobosporangium transversale]KAF9918829.1 hypothetical protein BX616_005207 [Lobosporangium transversale]ORZ05956.1 hypothetical protein BCR41DRAFT_425350 [Lobosporangium transversale]|eukprot:XP_021877337.1 hypothetical protein BCR41DRAFT_425350 [Lobosporangium transversale]
MASLKGRRSTKSAKATTPAVVSNVSSVSTAYLQELEDTFQLYDPENTGVMSLKSLRLAMRTLGFEASLENVMEIIREIPSLSIHRPKKKKCSIVKGMISSTNNINSNNNKNKGKEKQNDLEPIAEGISGIRRSSRVTSGALKTGYRSKYVDESDEALVSDDDDNDDDDEYEDIKTLDSDGGGDKSFIRRNTEENDFGDDNLYFTLQDFITIMIPNEDQHGQDEVSRIFQLFDLQGKGSIRIEDLRRVAKELAISMGDEELREMIEEADRDGDGCVTEQEFARILEKTGF